MGDEVLKGLAALGPALGSVVVVGGVCWRLLQIFDKFSDSLNTNTKTMGGMAENIKANTEVMEQIKRIIDDKYEHYSPRKSHIR